MKTLLRMLVLPLLVAALSIGCGSSDKGAEEPENLNKPPKDKQFKTKEKDSSVEAPPVLPPPKDWQKKK